MSNFISNKTAKDIRHYLKLSQQEFADKLGVSLATVALIETKRMNVTDRVQGRLAHIFDINDTEFHEYQQRKRALEQHISEEN